VRLELLESPKLPDLELPDELPDELLDEPLFDDPTLPDEPLSPPRFCELPSGSCIPSL